MNMHMHRMMIHSIWLSCLVMVIELLGACNSNFVAYGSVHIAIELLCTGNTTIVGSLHDEALQENSMQFGACGKPQGRLQS
jgi:hypothetical protein